MKMKTVLSGSYRKHFNEMIQLKKYFEKKGVEVLAPICNDVVNSEEEFVLLLKDPVVHPRILQDSIFAKIRHSSFLVLCNFDGYLGNAAVFEMGYAVSLGIQILSLDRVDDPNLAAYCQPICNVFDDFDMHNLVQSKARLVVDGDK
ncbi:MAG: hypothetical protein V1855_03350 [bacterium]